MSTEIIVALIALAGVLLSVTASLFTSMRLTSTELEKLRTEIRQTYADKLLEKRLDTYPSLSVLLSDFGKAIHYHKVTKAVVEELDREFEKWDSRLSILFSGYTGLSSYHFRLMLRDLAQQTDEEFQEQITSKEFRRELISRLADLENALKNDIGIYVVELPDVERRLRSYGELVEALEEQDRN